MFKLESYITPLILSYVDKYIKNLKPEDSQVSLWGGDAVFSNLDLRLDVLERELRMPFTFANGHIHELRIHVPWTKLGSEPVVITINTIECVLKLCEAGDGSTTESSGSVRSTQKVRGEPRVGGRQSEGQPGLVPPSYVQSLINRVLNNISVVCNNVVLKYVEDDIVLSLNVKSVEMSSVNGDWEKAFVDLTLPELVLRKLVRLLDLTVCLDRRNASGKITTYQDPLLYRCSLDCRIHVSFDGLHAKHVLSTKVDILCDQLDFSVTDHQLPMFLRLLELCLALHANEIPFPAPKSQAEQSGTGDGTLQLAGGEDESGQEGWGAWMWSYVPNGLSVFVDDPEDDSTVASSRPSSVFHMGLYIKSASFVVKVAESATGSSSFAAQKVNFRPLGSLETEGVFVDIVTRGIDVLNVQMGLTRLTGVIMGRCTCGMVDCQEDSPGSKPRKNSFFVAGGDAVSGGCDYLADSLFDQHSLENSGQRREYHFEWDEHFNLVSNVAMQQRTPAFAMDYFYLMEIPEDFSDKSSGFSVNDFEYSNLKERTVNRIIVGPSNLDITSSVYHRLTLILKASEPYDYEPYSKLDNETIDETVNPPTLEEVEELEKFVPSRILRLLVIKPTVRICVATHQHVQRSTPKSLSGRLKAASEEQNSPPMPKLPSIVVHAEIVDVQRQWAMYPRRVVKAAAFLRSPSSDALLHNSHVHFNTQLLGCGVYVDNRDAVNEEESRLVVVPPCNMSLYHKRLFFPSFWRNVMQPKSEFLYQAPQLKLIATTAQIWLLKNLWNSWFDAEWKLRSLGETSLVQDAFNGKLSLELTVSDIRLKTCDTDAVVAYDGVCAAFTLNLRCNEEKNGNLVVPVLHGGSEDKREIYTTEFFQRSQATSDVQSATAGEISPLVSFTFQLPKDSSNVNVPGIFVVICNRVVACLDPRLFEWFAYVPRTFHVTRTLEKHSPKLANEGDCSLVQESQSKVGSGLSSGPSTLPTESRSKSRGASVVFPESSGGTSGNGIFPDVVADLYPLLHGLNVHVEVGGLNVFLPTSAVPWPTDRKDDCIVGTLERLFSVGKLPDAVAINLPRISVANESQKHANLRSGRNVPVSKVEGWTAGSDQFPWAVQIDNYSVFSLTNSKDAQYLLDPGFVSATVAVNSKNSLVHTGIQNMSQLNVCIHCDFQPIRFQLSKVQAQLATEAFKTCRDIMPNILGLVASIERSRGTGGTVASGSSPEPATPTSKWPARSRKISAASSTADLTTIKGADNDEDLKNVMGQACVGRTSDGIKVSLWLQTTLPKLAVDIIGIHKERDWRLNFELEDISSSIDIQEVYSKIKLKVASLNATNYLKNLQTGQWDLGPYEGISICCSDRLTKTVHMPNPKTGIKTLCPHATFSESEDPQSAQGSFLLATFTRAQCRNVQKRWTKVLRDHSGNSDLGAKLRDMFEKSSSAVTRRHISEIDLKVASFDCVFVAPLVESACGVFAPVLDLFDEKVVVPQEDLYTGGEPLSNGSGCCGMPRICTTNLPLLYFNCSTVRVFVPRPLELYGEEHADRYPGGGASTSFGCRRKGMGPNRADDLVILQVGAAYVSPNVENPLSRVLLKPDVYNVAQRAGILLIPGSEVEERQYQIDVTGLCLSTGSWNELIQFTKNSLPPMEVTKLKTMSENPALEWNTKIQPEISEGILEVIFCPLVSRFDLRIIAAPAIIYEKSAHLDRRCEDVLVAGHSLEINATTDIEFFIGLHQVSLLVEQLRADLELLSHCRGGSATVPSHSRLAVPAAATVPARKRKDGKKEPMKEARDSGIDSEASTLGALLAGGNSANRLIPAQSPTPVFPLSQSGFGSRPPRSESGPKYTPFDVLLTAGRITVSVYNVEEVPRHVKPPKPSRAATAVAATRERVPSGSGPGSAARNALRKRSGMDVKAEEVSTSTSTEGSPARVIRSRSRQLSSKELELITELAGYEGSEESLDDGSSDENTDSNHPNDHHIIPLFYLLISQPYTFLKCSPSGQKLELSCFDINLKGSSTKKSISHGFPLLKPENYDVFWFETLPGDPDPKTGIPPALYTLTLMDFLTKPSLNLKLERPLKMNLSISKHREISGCVRSFETILRRRSQQSADEDASSAAVADEKEESKEEFTEKWRKTLAGIGRMSFQTQQMIFAFDTETLIRNAQIQICSSQATGNFHFKCDRDELLKEANAELFFGGCLVKTRFRDRTRTLLGPFSITAKGNSIWENWNIFYPFPQTMFKLSSDTVPVAVDQEHLTCLEVVAEHVREHFGGAAKDPSRNLPTFPFSSILPFASRKNSFSGQQHQQQVWQDDLRIGVFQYTQDADDLGLMPCTNEIVFCKEHGGHPASMTWRYPQPRALIRTEIHPVPFRAASETTNANWDEEKVEVQCALQFWDVLHSCFVTYRVFHLSETEHRVLDLPPGDAESCKDLAISHMWRVVMDYTDPDETYGDCFLHRGLVSPLALAACMRVDSCFNALFIPCFEFLVDFELVKITLSNYFPRTSAVTGGYVPCLMPYELDATRPEYQEFLTFCIENTSVRGRHWNKSCKLEIESVFFSELLDFKFLVLQSLLEPVSVKAQISVTQAEDKFLVAETSVDVGALHLRLGQSSIHTLALGLKAWNATEENRNCYLMNSYVICNGTQETLRFGQVDTDESIAIRKHQAHAYSWRTHKSKQVLHVCVEGMKWKWCDPFSIDEVGVQVRVVENKTQKATLIVRVERLNNAQNQITISGQLTIASRLAQHLEIRVKSLKQHPESVDPREHFSTLDPMSCIPSFVVQHEDAWYLQAKLVGENNHWSRAINIDETTSANGTLVKLSATDSGPSNNFWCHVFTQPCGTGLRKLVLLTPLYIVRTHLPLPLCLEITTPALSQTHSVDVEGNGQEHQIDCPGDTDLTHQLSFRLAPGLDVSSPPLPLSPTMILQASKQTPVSGVNIDELCRNWNSSLPYLWPYDSEELERDMETLPKTTLSGFVSERKHPQTVNVCQPNIELEVSLVQRWPGCQSLLVDVKPWGLLINKTGLEITFHQKDDLTIPKDAVFALSKVEGTFKLGVKHSGNIYYSNAIEVSSEDWSLNRYWPKVSGVLSRNGNVLCTIGIRDNGKLAVCYLTVCAREKEGIRIFVVKPHYTMVNATDRSFEMAAFAVDRAGPKTGRSPEDFSVLSLERDSSPVPVLIWDVVGQDTVADHDEASHYVKFRVRSRDSEWSLAAVLRSKTHGSGSTDCVYSVVCVDPGDAEQRSGNFVDDSKPFIVTSHCHGGSTFLFLEDDQKPSLKLHNNCGFALFYGQGVASDLNGSEVTVQEEAEFPDELPVLPPQTSRYYTFPFVAEKFPEIYDPQLLPRLHLAQLRTAEEEISWSDGIGVFSQSDQFLNIPGCGDIRVRVERTAVAVHVFMDPVNRIEVSAKEIRSRIKAKTGPEKATPNWRKAKLVPQKVKIIVRKSGEEEDDAVEGHLRSPDGGCGDATLPLPESQRSSPKKPKAAADTGGHVLFYGGLRLKHICLTLVSPHTEVVRLSLDRIHASTRPLIDSGVVRKQEALLCVGDLQVDNQLQALGGHDFPVVLVGDHIAAGNVSSAGGSSSSSEVDATELSRVRREALVAVAAVLQRSDHRWHVQEVDVSMKPLAAYVEDTLLYALGALARGCQMTVADRWPRDVMCCDRSVPAEVRLEHLTLAHPLRVRRLTVRPVSLLLSVRASLKLFIALDRTPLSFQAFVRHDLTTTWYRLGHNLAMHYLSGAVFRAGWVVGSLDLLANPCGFARAVSTGMADLVRLPYQGLMHGPWAFVVGVSQGSSSLLRHVSSGTLVSLTNLASSISRNMDRLSLDQGHLERNEEMRRCPPRGLGSGLAQGLTGLGISLLGAVAGIVDHPFQSIQGGDSDVVLSPTATAASVISGVGKGLVGIVTKPIGGAAEFVAQTGQGILHGAGWAKVLKQRYPPTFEQPSSATNSVLKYRWKMLPDCPSEASVFAIEATHINGTGSYAAAVLLLTPEVLFVVSVDSDTQQQAFPLMELDCVGHAADPTLVYFLPREAPDSNCLKPEEKNLDRITEFVSRSSKYMLGRGGSSKNEESESASDTSSQPSRTTVATRFFVNPCLRGTFLTLYQMAQRRVLGKGYPV